MRKIVEQESEGATTTDKEEEETSVEDVDEAAGMLDRKSRKQLGRSLVGPCTNQLALIV